MPGAVGCHDAIVAEVRVRGVVIVAVASIDTHGASVQLVIDTLINPVPDEAALGTRFLAYLVPIFLESTHRIAHGMCIFRLDDRARIVEIKVTFHVVGIVVLRAEDIGVILKNRTLILHQARRILLLQPVIDSHEIHTIACLVAHTPDDD